MSNHSADIIKNLKYFYTNLSDNCGYETGRIHELTWVWNRSGNWPAYIIGTPFKNHVVEISTEIGDHDLPPFWIMEHEAEQSVMEFLEGRDIRVIRRWKGMVLDPGNYRAPGRSSDLDIHFNDPDDLPDFLTMINRDLLSGTRMEEKVADALKSGKEMIWVVGYVDRKPASAGLLFIFEEVAGLYMIVTGKAHRGRGFGSQVTASLVEYALKEGVKKIVLHATPLGERIYGKIGFKSVMDMPILWKLGY